MRRGTKWIIGILILLFTAALVFLLVRYSQKQQERDAALSAMLEQAEPVENALQEARRELSQRERAMEERERMPSILVGYQLEQNSDIQLAEKQAKQFGFSPVFVLDTTLEQAEDLLKTLAEKPYEIVFTASPCTRETLDAKTLQKQLEGESVTAVDTGCFLLRQTDDDSKTIDLIDAAGYRGCIRHADAGENTVLEQGLVTLSYSQIKSGRFSVKSRLDKALKKGQALLFVFDLEALHNGDMTEADVESALKIISTAWAGETSPEDTVTGSLEQIRQWEAEMALTRSEFETYAEEQNQKIAALEQELNEIYEQWNEGDIP